MNELALLKNKTEKEILVILYELVNESKTNEETDRIFKLVNKFNEFFKIINRKD